MIKFTKKEISLCKQVAEKYRKSFDFGDSYINPFNNVRLHTFDKTPGHKFPLWTISDCLKFLRKKNYDVTLYYFAHYGYWTIQIWNKSSEKAFYSDYGKENNNKTPLEACLKAVLAVLEKN